MAICLCEILIIFLAYLLGSIPFGYLITRFSAKKNILEIGWKKTSGSNVFKNIGKWQGALTGILDVGKGFLAVWLVQRLGLLIEIQIFAGVAAVVGHNWSCFLKGAGGRGIGTFIGAFLAFSPEILCFSLIPFAFLALIWNASIGTILFLLFAIILSVYFSLFGITGVFTLLCLIPIFIKRLSPIADFVEPRPRGREEIKKGNNKSALIRNRLLFDNDKALFDFRIKKIISWLTKT